MTKPRAPRRDRKERPFDLDDVCARIEAGESMRAISARYAQNPGRLTEWIALDPERIARTRDARERSAFACDELALAVLQDSRIDIARAREIASHYRWRAKTRMPRMFSDRVETFLSGGLTLEALVVESMRTLAPPANAPALTIENIESVPPHGLPITASDSVPPHESDPVHAAWVRCRSAFFPDSTPEG